MKRRKATSKNQWTGFQGYWLAPDGAEREVSDHFLDVRTFPSLYGLDPARAERFKAPDRERVLRALMRAGYIRVRGHRNYTAFEFDRWTESSKSRIVGFMGRHGFWPQDRVSLHSLREVVYQGPSEGVAGFPTRRAR